MIGRWSSKSVEVNEEEPKGFDAFELRLGDVMRGERATLGKSLLDVQRELRIMASYIAAIENADPDAFDTPGFIAGYVRSYARYLGMDPDTAFDTFCTDSGFSVAHGMSADASVIKKSSFEERTMKRSQETDLFAKPVMPFTPQGESILSRIEPAAVGSLLVLVCLIGAIGYGGWSVLKEVQRVQVAPVDQTPVVLSDLDPLDGSLPAAPDASGSIAAPRIVETQRADALDRLYRPQALDVPRLTPRDAPIASIDPRLNGNFPTPPQANAPGSLPSGLPSGVTNSLPNTVPGAVVQTAGLETIGNVPQVLEGAPTTVLMVAVEPSWVQVKAADGSVIYEATMNKGDTWEIPATEEPPVLRTGQSGAIYFAMDNEYIGPVGPRGAVTSNVPLARQALTELYEVANLEDNALLSTYVAELQSAATAGEPAGE